MAPGLTALGTAQLRALRDKLAAARLPSPLRSEDLGAAAALAGLDAAGALVVVDAVLAERARAPEPPQVVWTGPSPVRSAARDTSAVLKALFEGAQARVLVAGYCFDHGRTLFEPLHRAMVERHVEVRFYLNIAVKPGEDASGAREAIVRARLDAFLEENWPFGPPRPALYYDPRPLTTERFSSLHAKCVVVDEDAALVTSANFTDRGQSRNVEVGALIRDPIFVRALAAQWENATTHGMFLRDGG